jgi:hypothetical protein
MKLSKTTWLIIGIGIIVIAAASLGVAYSQKADEKSELEQELSLARQRLDKYLAELPTSQKEELESQLAEVESQLDTAKASLHQLIESIEASTTLFEVAQNCNVEITRISSSPPTSSQLENVTFSALSLTVGIEGEVPNLITFVYRWIQENVTGIVTSVEITVPETTEEEEEEGKPSAIIKLLIYTYEGD